MKKAWLILVSCGLVIGMAVPALNAGDKARNPFQRDLDSIKSYESRIKEEKIKTKPDQEKIKKYEERINDTQEKINKKVQREVEKRQKEVEKLESRITKLKEWKRNTEYCDKQLTKLQIEIRKWEGYAVKDGKSGSGDINKVLDGDDDKKDGDKAEDAKDDKGKKTKKAKKK